MGLYRRYFAPVLVDTACSPKALGKWRARVVEDLAGDVVEIGFGAGRNLPFYPETVTSLTAVEPSEGMRQRGAKRIADFPSPLHWGGLDGQHLDLADNSFDAAVVTFSLCTIPDPNLALRELRRVVRPGGELRVLEHGLAPDPKIAKWQHRLDPIEKVIADGCHLTRDCVALVEANGWTVTEKFQRFAPGPKPWSYLTSLRAN
jgi:ubiquinone/menaquinone biosynthesis C-methylase UbiE